MASSYSIRDRASPAAVPSSTKTKQSEDSPFITILIWVLLITSIWDAITTFYGTKTALGDGILTTIISVIISVTVCTTALSSSQILRRSVTNPLDFILFSFWVIAIGYDMYTAYLGNLHYVLSGEHDIADSSKVVICGISLIVSGAPICASHLIYLDSESVSS